MGARRPLPDCGHRYLVECPLTMEDWRAVFFAYLGFLHTCRMISDAAHEREKAV